MKKRYCKNCGRPLDSDDSEYCETCIENKDYYKDNEDDKIEEYGTNKVAKVIKILAIISAFVGFVLGANYVEELEVYAVVFIVVSIISSIFVYAIGEIIQLLEDIKNK